MRESQVHDQVAAFLFHSVADAVDFQRFAEALLNALHHVVQQRTGQAVQCTVLRLVIGALDQNLSVFLLKDHGRMQRSGQLALGALDRDHVAFADFHFDACGNGNGHSTNS